MKAISENGIDSLVRLVGRRGLQLCAGRRRAANVAPGWGTPRRSAGIKARAPTGSHDRPVRVDRSNNQSTRYGSRHPQRPTAVRPPSTIDAAVRTRAPASCVPPLPALDLRAEPEPDGSLFRNDIAPSGGLQL
jgi:hypothetical protein